MHNQAQLFSKELGIKSTCTSACFCSDGPDRKPIEVEEILFINCSRLGIRFNIFNFTFTLSSSSLTVIRFTTLILFLKGSPHLLF